MTNLSIYLPDAEEEWASENVENLSRYVQMNIRRDMRQEDRDQELKTQNKRLTLIQLLAFLFLGFTLLSSAVLSATGYPNEITVVMIGMSGIFAVVYALLSIKTNGVDKKWI